MVSDFARISEWLSTLTQSDYLTHSLSGGGGSSSSYPASDPCDRTVSAPSRVYAKIYVPPALGKLSNDTMRVAVMFLLLLLFVVLCCVATWGQEIIKVHHRVHDRIIKVINPTTLSSSSSFRKGEDR